MIPVSVIIPTYNEAVNIEQAIRSCQTNYFSEIIVVDGGSQDETIELARTRHVTVLESEPGRAIQQNLGAKAATGEILLFLHADNWLSKPVGEQIQSAFKDENIQAAAFKQKIHSPKLFCRVIEWGNAWRVRYRGLAFGDQGICIRKDFFAELGGFPDVPFLEDLILMDQVRSQEKVKFLPGPLHISARRWEENGPIKQTLHNMSLIRAYRKGKTPAELAVQYKKHKD